MRVLVTGPGGIGSEVTRVLLARGHEVVVGWHRTKEALDDLPVPAFPVDVTSSDSCKELVAAAWRAGPLGALVNCFGTIDEAPLLKVGPDDVQRLIQVNLTGVIHMCRATTFRLMKAGGGAIVNVGSAASTVGIPGLSVYSAAKGALASFGRSLAAELAPYRITCNTVSPGFLNSGPTAARPAGWHDAVARHIPLGRLGTPAEVAELVAHLVSPAGRYITGQEFVIDGGWTLGSPALARDLAAVEHG